MADVVVTPYVDELARRLGSAGSAVEVVPGRDGSVSLGWRHPQVAHPVTVVTREDDLRAAVLAIGREGQDALRPGSGVEDAGFDLLLVHLDEVVATRDTTRPLRITGDGLQWPEARA